MNRILAIEAGRVVAEPGVFLGDMAAAATGQELRMFPSTRATASTRRLRRRRVGRRRLDCVGWDARLLRLRVMTMEAELRALELTGENLHKAVHA